MSFPVLADPDWGYGVDFSIGANNPGIAYQQLHSCFNCYFPVDGAPVGYRSIGQDLPLTVTMLNVTQNFHCTMQQTLFKADAMNWYFTSAPGHIDGLGSAVFLDIIRLKTGQSRLFVSGQIHNDFPGGVPNPAYVLLATHTWQIFADNLTL